MASLTLNGVTVPVQSWEQPAPAVLGDRGRGTSGRSESAVRKRKRIRRGRTTPMAKADAEALGHLLEGEGDSWSFDATLYSARGLGPSSGTTGLITGGKYGSGVTVSNLTYAVPTPSAWTLMGWRRNGTGYGDATWHHWLRLSSGTKYRDGVATAAEPGLNVSGAVMNVYSVADPAVVAPWQPFTGYAAGARILSPDGVVFASPGGNGSGSADEPFWEDAPTPGDEVEEDPGGPAYIWVNANDGDFDDVVFLPYLVPTSWVSQLYAEASARAWTAQPYLRAAGDLVNPAAVAVKGRVTGVTPAAHKRAGTFERGGRALAFELLERG